MTGIKVTKAHGDYDEGTSKFFGSPTCPEEWLENGFIGDDDFFFCQLKISEFKTFDIDGLLPQNGFIYFFLKEENGKYIPNVRYTPSSPETLIEDFNTGFDFLGDTETEYSIDFFETEDTDGSFILKKENDNVILLKYDPLDDNMPSFLSETEKTGIFRIKESDLKKLEFSDVTFDIE